MLRDDEDAMGHLMWDHFQGQEVQEVVEREDGYIDVTNGPSSYFASYEDWARHEQRAMRYARGGVLDIGVGAGRHALYLQDQGLGVTGVDISPRALRVARERGLRRTEAAAVTQLSRRLGTFDTLMMMGNNFGLFANPRRMRWLLRRFAGMTTEAARIIAETRDVYQTERPEHLEYHAWNRRRGRMSGQVRIRVRYRKYATPWFDYLMVSREELQALLAGTAWQVHRFVEPDGELYVAILEKR
ncbi:MAG: methyltransferase domain-containing protein [Thermoplasmata archaeon]